MSHSFSKRDCYASCKSPATVYCNSRGLAPRGQRRSPLYTQANSESHLPAYPSARPHNMRSAAVCATSISTYQLTIRPAVLLQNSLVLVREGLKGGFHGTPSTPPPPPPRSATVRFHQERVWSRPSISVRMRVSQAHAGVPLDRPDPTQRE